LTILLIIVGLPFFVVSTTAPLLQKWFGYTGHPAAKDPYFLYGASNLGSMLALFVYPFLIEPYFVLRNQALLWTIGYEVLVVAVYFCMAMIWRSAASVPVSEQAPTTDLASSSASAPEGQVETAVTAKAPVHAGRGPSIVKAPPVVDIADGGEVTVWRRLKWVCLAAVPSSMMLGITTHITTDLSPVPMIWLIPLMLYLLSFILVFIRWPIVWVEEPHKVMVVVQPLAIAAMLLIDFLAIGHSYLRTAIVFDVAGFFFTAMVCHGELAKDRPSTRHLTEFYLMMSIGGMLGGMFNGLLAPNIKYLFELQAAIIAAGFLRPILTRGGWVAEFVAGMIDSSAGEGTGKKRKGHGEASETAVTPRLAVTVDLLLAALVGGAALILTMASVPSAATYGIALALSCLLLFRPVRYGAALALIIGVHALDASRYDNTEYRTRGYFGLITVNRARPSPNREGDAYAVKLGLGDYKQMIHGHINHGMNFLKPADEKDWGNPRKDYSRHATTYYHRFGPAGVVMEQFCWFKEPENHFSSDSRIGASLLGQLAPIMGATLPADALVDLWSEPPFATIGLGTGTMASYARPYQHMHYYEIDNLVKRLSLRKEWKPNITYLDDLEFRPNEKYTGHFTYLRDALKRGVHLQVLMGDARLRMAMPYKNHYCEDSELGGGPMNFYHMMVVDAFSSDAIPAHLITKESIAMYFDRLTEKGILCVHTSNRFVDLVKVVADVANSLGYSCLRAHDNAPYLDKVGHFTSEWVMVARKSEYLKHLREPKGYREALRAAAERSRRGYDPSEPYWETPTVHGRYAWTDDFYNILKVLR
ncbi:MAG: hypothetical protein NZO58_01630, partial [Gemmataceae bacterium]|nr:hypothetical protein [Gemmataceae bacterium]